MSRVVKYAIVESKDSDRLVDGVHHLIGEGFQPQGGIVVTYCSDSGEFHYTQAMVRHADE